ncbi:ABC transporter substrate-binding protein [Pelosinus sp. UFO1]|uniref:ABC transporter substrate-binding protein n=1 Tax=Pelosinus sp. UFO1 TaxID=484770 RepID=UPI0004D1871C|nr:ABC transporter substrate-binding protein [Pelosinus sp. UFO1]AIF52363.1 ABC-type transporter, periplasmic subunit family 3 [Pelosinus sp. UFO1]
MKIIKSMLLLFSVLVALAGCGTNSATSDADSKRNVATSSVDLSKVTIRMGETGWARSQEGLKAAGLQNTPYKVEYSVFQGGNMQLEAMAANHLDLATSSEIPPIFASQSGNGGNFKVIGFYEGTTLNQELVVPKGSNIKAMADLKGKKVAYVKATTSQYFLLKMLKQAGMTWDDIIPVQMSTSDGLIALVGGKVDALAGYGNAIITAHQQGATVLVSAKDILSGNFMIEATPDAINDPAKHAAIVDYLSRLDKSYEWAAANPEKWAEIIAVNTHEPFEQSLITFKEGNAQRPNKVKPTSMQAIASEQDVADVFLGAGVLKNKIDVSSFWSNAFDEEIKKLLENKGK